MNKKMKDNKFILLGLGDENSKEVAEVLGNKTCKKLLDFLGDVKEASEKDIADGLGMKLNTVEYNLKKLIKAGFIEKSKNFFWSVKGKKIRLYKLAKKHIIIGTKKPNLNYLKSILPAILVAIMAIALVGIFIFPDGEKEDNVIIGESQLKQFSSQTELNDFLKSNSEIGRIYGEEMVFADGGSKSVGFGVDQIESLNSNVANDYSTTNVQVENVDEADIVKNDGRYIYTVSENKVIIVNAYPADEMKIVSEIKFNSSISQIFINGDNLIIFGTGYDQTYSKVSCEGLAGCINPSTINSVIYIYDISDKENPELKKEIATDGRYVQSRMIGDYVYVISTKYVNVEVPEPPVFYAEGNERRITATEIYYWDYPDRNYIFTSIMAIDVENGDFNNKVYLTGGTRMIYVSQNNIYLTYNKKFNYENYANDFAEKVAFPLLLNNKEKEIKDILDLNQPYYVKLSKINQIIYDYSQSLIGDDKAEFDKELISLTQEFQKEINMKNDKTVVHKININKDEIDYLGVGEVPGKVLNQFSMDEHKGYFRIATTTANSGRDSSLNHIYVLDEDLKIIGKVEDLAKGEQIYSARFLGERAYLVTFKNIDPLFVVDLSNPKNPEILGYLKITGYSNYLHPYDENHLIGIGKETQGGDEDFSWYQGVKISLFDVSDVENPIEKTKYEIGDRGTSSDALYDHKAVLFDKEKEILVIPIQLYEIDKSKYESDIPDYAYGEFVWQGAYVFRFNLNEIELIGKISHSIESKYSPAKEESIGTIRILKDGMEFTKLEDYIGKANWCDYNNNEWCVSDDFMDRQYRGVKYNLDRWQTTIKRSLYINDILYTISKSFVKANNLIDLNLLIK